MPYEIGPNNPYMIDQARKRMARGRATNIYGAIIDPKLEYDPMGYPIDPKACITIKIDDPRFLYAFDKSNPFDWSEIINWIRDQGYWCFTWSSFTGEWRREFAFLSEAEVIALKLRFS